MAKFPEPPAPSALRRVAPVWQHLSAGTELWRVYFRGGDFPTVWNEFRAYGPLRSARFDHHVSPPREQDRMILYGAGAEQPEDDPIETCVAEVFQAGRHIDTAFRDPWLVGFRLARDVQLLDLTGVWPTRAGASMTISSGRRDRARRWSAAIYEAYAEVEGLWYRSSMHANRPAFALYERAGDALPRHPFLHRSVGDPLLSIALHRVAEDLGYTIT